MRFVVLVPYRPNDGPVGQRYRWLWDQVRPRLEEVGPVYTGEPDGETWSRSQACNAAARAAGDWDLALVGDCDTVPDPASIYRAIWWVQQVGGAVRPHMQRTMLSQKGTIAFCQRGPAALTERAHFERSHAGGGLLIVTREAWETVGGYDDSFEGWGYEDSDLNLRLLRHSTWDRLPGTAWHLWHPREENRPSQVSKQRYQKLLRTYRRDIARWAEDKGLVRPERVF